MRHKLIEQLRWFIRLRWMAVIGVSVTIYVASQLPNISMPVHLLYKVVTVLAVYNVIFFLFLPYVIKRSRKDPLQINRLANIQISCDLLCLGALIHYSGGIENPFFCFFVFHMIIAGILLTNRAVFYQATYGVALFISIALLEYYHIIPHYHLWKNVEHGLYDNGAYVFGVIFVFTSTMYIAAYMAASVSGQLREREANLEKANAMLEEKDRVKSEYVLRVAHDIRGDLAAIRSCVDPVITAITGPINDSQFNLLNRTKIRTDRLIDYTNKLLEITTMKLNRKFNTELFSFKDLLNEISVQLKEEAGRKQIRTHVKIHERIDKIRGIRVYLFGALLNIVQNAVHYTPAGGDIYLNAELKNNLYSVRVRDTGIGIPQKDLPHIFEEFYRGDNAIKEHNSGFGFGLSMIKEAVDIHNGKTSVQSELGKGTCFSIEIPAGNIQDHST